MVKDALGDRMKANYEDRYRFYLTRRTPVIIRVDGNAFHTFCKNFEMPYDMEMKNSMWDTAKDLCKNIMGCQIAYVQSDEISLLLVDYKKLTSQAWFDYNLQKITSIAAAMATKAFNLAFPKYAEEVLGDSDMYNRVYLPKFGKAMFDARAFNIPISEVCNYFIWRQQDATRNSIETLGRCFFSSKELHKVNCNQIQDKLMVEKNVNWNDMPTHFKRGACVVKKLEEIEIDTPHQKGKVMSSTWDVDAEIPIFTQDRNYIEQYLHAEEGEA